MPTRFRGETGTVPDSRQHCTISASPSIDSTLLSEIEKVLSSDFQVTRKTYIQATAAVPPETILILVALGSGVAGGFLGRAGERLYDRLAALIVNGLFKKEKKGHTVRLIRKTPESELSFECHTEEAETAKVALELIPKIASSTNGHASFFFNNEKKDWEEMNIGDDVSFTINVVAATTGPVVLNGKKLFLTKDKLEEIANNGVGTPILFEHRGKPIGRITNAWVDGDKLCYRAAIFKPYDKRSQNAIDKIKSGELKGMSIAFDYLADDEERS